MMLNERAKGGSTEMVGKRHNLETNKITSYTPSYIHT